MNPTPCRIPQSSATTTPLKVKETKQVENLQCEINFNRVEYHDLNTKLPVNIENPESIASFEILTT